MNYLLDTHVLLWMLAAPARLTPAAAAAIRNPAHTVFVSAVSSVEIAIKRRLGKLEAPATLDAELHARGLSEMPLRFAHGERMNALPVAHGDPFDRMLAAQAEVEGLTLITHDRKFDAFPIRVLWT